MDANIELHSALGRTKIISQKNSVWSNTQLRRKIESQVKKMTEFILSLLFFSMLGDYDIQFYLLSLLPPDKNILDLRNGITYFAC